MSSRSIFHWSICFVLFPAGFHSPITLHVFIPLFPLMSLCEIVLCYVSILMHYTVMHLFRVLFSRGMFICLNIIIVTVCAFCTFANWLEVSMQCPSVGFSCLNKVCACSQLSALLYLTPFPVRTPMTHTLIQSLLWSLPKTVSVAHSFPFPSILYYKCLY